MKYNDINFNKHESVKTYNYVKERMCSNTLRCNRCCSPVIKSDIAGFSYQCMNCDEDLFNIEVHEGEPYTKEETNELFCDTRDILLLDN